MVGTNDAGKEATSAPRVSVCMVTYNHALFIRRAVESVLEQVVDFQIELVIGDDFSTDGTREILKEIDSSANVRVRLLLSDQKIGAYENWRRTYDGCNGEYVALLDGDDYWTCNRKIQKQVAFLEDHAEVAMSCHRVAVESDSGPGGVLPAGVVRGTITVQEILDGTVFPIPCSVVLRRMHLPRIPPWIEDMPSGDCAIYLEMSQRGEIAFLDEVLAAYRVHAGGIWSRHSIEEREMRCIESLLGFAAYTSPVVSKVAREEAMRRVRRLVDQLSLLKNEAVVKDEKYRSSKSFRLGSALLAFPRLVRAMLRREATLK